MVHCITHQLLAKVTKKEKRKLLDINKGQYDSNVMYQRLAMRPRYLNAHFRLVPVSKGSMV